MAKRKSGVQWFCRFSLCSRFSYLQSKPTFEIKYLKNFLTENGYRFAVRMMVGKGAIP
jgi:hypothetical protein